MKILIICFFSVIAYSDLLGSNCKTYKVSIVCCFRTVHRNIIIHYKPKNAPF